MSDKNAPPDTTPAQQQQELVDSQLSPNHLKLLYLISLYAVAANSTKQNERWIRQVPLLVLMFEGIINRRFDFDYAPASIRLAFRGRTLRRWINISREGKAALDDLWDAHLVNGLKLSSDDFQPITAYQVSIKGQQLLSHISRELRQEVDSFVFPPSPSGHSPFMVRYDGYKFVLCSGTYTKPSSITESEDVSYVSSPFLPRCLRSSGYYQAQERSNRHRAAECAIGLSSISKKTNEAITLGDVYALVGEWVPFGSNQIVALNERMGALDRCQGGILTSFVDHNPTDTQFRVPVGQTQVRILDFDFVRFINFEAESHFPETKGIVQIEHFGMHLNCDGSLIYGIKVEAIMDRKEDDISIDHLARLLVDVHQDSSMLVNDLLSRYQLSLLEMLYLGDSFQRNKYNCILATHIFPKLSAREYVHNPCYANELAQVLGDVYAWHDLTKDDVLVVGKAGILFCGPNIFRFESVFTAYVGLVCRDIFIKNFFARTFVLDATLKEIRQLIHLVHREPIKVYEVREKLAVASKDTILLAETLEYLLDSIEDMHVNVPTSTAEDPVEAKLYQVLALQQLKAQTIMRCHDSIKLMENTMLQLEQLQMIAESTATNQLEIACQRVNLNTKALMKASEQQQRTLLTIQVIQHIIGGLFTFDVIDRLTAGSWNVELPSWVHDLVLKPVIAHAFAWWAINLVVFVSMLSLVTYVTNALMLRSLGACVFTCEMNRKISLEDLQVMLQRKRVRRVDYSYSAGSTPTTQSRVCVVVWEDTDAVWSNLRPLIEVCYDEKYAFLLFVSVRYSGRKAMLREDECLQKITEVLTKAHVLETT
ncbi:TPA: hypothetical protein N0F65_004720 [Lagenidium giganteum]|uniref:Uncharacterized protein n=1 Tax=Lagenidium giganteum TaxID=4803 RepID=A0AAV2Z854_9STRA|nr:TPA: hypothetical protein N0F65_004720 [Lagenidium giganteum]